MNKKYKARLNELIEMISQSNELVLSLCQRITELEIEVYRKEKEKKDE
jgi:hypothetical protein